jgi:hypothetical protein
LRRYGKRGIRLGKEAFIYPAVTVRLFYKSVVRIGLVKIGNTSVRVTVSGKVCRLAIAL